MYIHHHHSSFFLFFLSFFKSFMRDDYMSSNPLSSVDPDDCEWTGNSAEV